MIQKSLAILALVIVLALCVGKGTGNCARELDPKKFSYEAIAIKENRTEVVFQGNITAEQFQKWFKSDYAVGGERIEIPKEATLFGTLVLTDGHEILVMPFYAWGDEKHRNVRCQGFEFGKAPKFSAAESSERAFLQSMKRQLETLR